MSFVRILSGFLASIWRDYCIAVPSGPVQYRMGDGMGTIIPRSRKDGSISYQAQIVIKRDGLTYREVRTFERKQAASAWCEKRERELSKPGALEQTKAKNPLLSEVIDRYTNESIKQIGKTKAQVLRSIKQYDIAQKRCSDVTSADITSFVRELSEGREPQTVGNYLSHLAAIFAIARPAWGYPLDQRAMRDAQAVAKRLGLTTKSRKRDRRPTLDELDRLLTHFGEIARRRPASAPMQKVVIFALFSARRQEEITRITWADLDEAHNRVLVRDMKNPGEKIGNDVWCDVPEPAMKIIRTMPRTGDRIFPYSTDAISAAFTRACKFLAIEDLHFHDLRHEGVSWLFETGKDIPRVAAVSGHRSWSSLQRYAHIRQTKDKYEDWKWLKEPHP